jgi:hypothetical protein
MGEDYADKVRRDEEKKVWDRMAAASDARAQQARLEARLDDAAAPFRPPGGPDGEYRYLALLATVPEIAVSATGEVSYARGRLARLWQRFRTRKLRRELAASWGEDVGTPSRAEVVASDRRSIGLDKDAN